MITKRFKLHKACGSDNVRPFVNHVIATSRRLIATDGHIITVVTRDGSSQELIPDGYIPKEQWQIAVKGGQKVADDLVDLSKVEPEQKIPAPDAGNLLKKALHATGREKVFSVKLDMAELTRLTEALGRQGGQVELFFSKKGFTNSKNYRGPVTVKVRKDQWENWDRSFGVIMPAETKKD